MVLHTDEDTTTQSVLSDALVGPGVETTHVDRAFIILSYDPTPDDRFPDGCPVVEVPIRQKPAAAVPR